MCDFENFHNTGLKSHMTQIYGEKNNNFFCEQCEKTFESKKKLKEHIYCVHTKPWY